MRFFNLYSNDVKLEKLFILKLIKYVRISNLFKNDVNLDQLSKSNIFKDVKLCSLLAMMSSLSFIHIKSGQRCDFV